MLTESVETQSSTGNNSLTKARLYNVPSIVTVSGWRKMHAQDVQHKTSVAQRINETSFFILYHLSWNHDSTNPRVFQPFIRGIGDDIFSGRDKIDNGQRSYRSPSVVNGLSHGLSKCPPDTCLHQSADWCRPFESLPT